MTQIADVVIVVVIINSKSIIDTLLLTRKTVLAVIVREQAEARASALFSRAPFDSPKRAISTARHCCATACETAGTPRLLASRETTRPIFKSRRPDGVFARGHVPVGRQSPVGYTPESLSPRKIVRALIVFRPRDTDRSRTRPCASRATGPSNAGTIAWHRRKPENRFFSAW